MYLIDLKLVQVIFLHVEVECSPSHGYDEAGLVQLPQVSEEAHQHRHVHITPHTHKLTRLDAHVW